MSDELKSWMAEMFGSVEEMGEVSLIGLIHFNGRGEEVEIHSMKSGHKLWKNVEEMTDTFDRIASRHARGLQGVQSFSCQAVFGTQAKPSRFLPFQKNGRLEFGAIPGGMATEPPTDVGIRSQGMRQAEMIVQGTFSAQRGLMESQQRALDARDKRIAELEKESRELFVALRNELQKTVELAHERRMQEQQYIRSTFERQKLIGLLPALSNSLAGREVFPSSAQDSALIETLVANVTPDEIKLLSQMLGQKSPELAALIMARFDEVQKKIERDQDQLHALTREATGNDPLADSGGEAAPSQLNGVGASVAKQLLAKAGVTQP